jgi:hypothetical protein
LAGVAGVAGVAILALGVSGCANHDALILAHQACRDVNQSLALYRHAQADSDPAQAALDQAQALRDLRSALPIAATAAGENAQWQALMTTLSESSRVSEGVLAHALQAQCSTLGGP